MIQPTWWNLDETFVASVRSGLVALRDKGSGHPDRFDGPAEWRMFLTGIIEDLGTGGLSGNPVTQARQKAALHLFVDHLEEMWD